MYIGEVSKITGASIKAIRFYEEIGLLNDVGRSGKYRIYNRGHVTLIELILKAKTLGFKLSEMKSFVEQQNPVSPWECVLDLISNKADEIDSEMRTLSQQKKELLRYQKSVEDCLAENPNCSVDDMALDSTP